MFNNKSRYFTLFIVIVTLSLSIQTTFGQTPAVAPQTPAATPASPIPLGDKKEKDAVLKAVSDVAKAAIEANKATMETTGAFYQQHTAQVSQLFTYGMAAISAFVAIFAAIVTFLGVKGYESLREYYKTLRQYTVDRCDAIVAEFSKRLDAEQQKLTTIMEQTQSKATDAQAKMKNGEAEISLNIVISRPNMPTSEKEGHYAKALTSLEESLKITGAVDPVTRAHTYAMRGYIRREQSDFPEALNDITAALGLVQDNASYYFNAACYNNLNGNKEKARNLLAQACALNPIYKAAGSEDPDLVGL